RSHVEARHLLLDRLVQSTTAVGLQRVYRLDGLRALLARLQDGAAKLLAIGGLAPAVPLDHVGEHVLDVLVGGVAAVALETLAAAADELALAPDARIDDAVLGVSAEWTLHGVTSAAPRRAGIVKSAPPPRHAPSPPPWHCRDCRARRR